jgi:hypothetical protein
MGKVFLAESARNFDLSGAQQYGETVELTDRLSPFRVKNTVQVLLRGLADAGFDPEKDYICLTGRSVIVAMFLALAAGHYGAVNILVYDARNATYERRCFATDPEQIEENPQWTQIPNGSNSFTNS